MREIVVRASPGNPRRGILSGYGVRLPVALGRGGIAHRKREGDGGTPAGRFRLVSVLYRAGRPPPATGLPSAPFGPDQGWCDDPAHPSYNRPVRLPFAGRHEKFWRKDRLYDLVVVIDFNLKRPRPGAGSAIFMHVASPNFSPTDGCIALRDRDLRRLLRRIGPETILTVV